MKAVSFLWLSLDGCVQKLTGFLLPLAEKLLNHVHPCDDLR